MSARHRIATILLGLIMPLTPTAADASDPVPVAPVEPTSYRGWERAFVLENDAMRVVLAPETGRLIHLGFAGEDNLLRVDEPALPPQSQASEWVNAGGDWVWPVAQPHWTQFEGVTWPPPPLFDSAPWSGRAWRSEDDSLNGFMSREYGAPLHVRLSRSVRLDPGAARVVIHQRMERLADSTIPVALWQIAQMHDPEMIVMATGPESAMPNGWIPLLFDAPDTNHLQSCDGAVVYTIAPGSEHKVGSDSPRAWVAGYRDGRLLLLRADPGDAEGPYPDGGCTVQLYANHGFRYGELETLSVEQALATGETLDNTIEISLHRIAEPPATPCDLARQVQQLLGELPAPEAPAEIPDT